MSVETILSEAARLGVTLILENGRLYAHPRNAVTDTLATLIRSNRHALITRLRVLSELGVGLDTPPNDTPSPGLAGLAGPHALGGTNVIDLAAERIARLDRERNERDRRCGRGYDYDPRLNACAICGDPAGLIVPAHAAINGRRHFCGMDCFKRAGGKIKERPA